MKNYYDELEVSKTASKEVIEKVYKVLAKKYHPDTAKELDKQAAEEKFKIIGEAYEILSDVEKRKKYDLELEQSNPTISYEDYMDVINQRDSLNIAFNELKNEFYQFKNNVQNQYQQTQFNQSQYGQGQPNQNQYSQNPFNQSQYQQQNRYSENQNFNNQFNNYQTPNMRGPHANSGSGNKGKKYYYNTVTGQPVSASDYYKYRIKKFISNIGFYIILIIIFLTLIKSLLTNGLQELLF